MFHSPRSMDLISTKRLLEEKCQTIEQLKTTIEELKIRHEKKEKDLMKHIGLLYNDLQQNKKKMAYLVHKYQKQKKSHDFKDISTQTEEPTNYHTLQSNNLEYISATPQPQSDHSLSSPSLSTTDQSSRKHNESSSSAYNTADSLPSSIYSEENQSLERVLNAACTMYTTQNNLEHTIKLQEELFRQHLRLRGIDLNDESEHFYDNIDSETSDFEKQTILLRNRHEKKNRSVRFSLHNEGENKCKKVSTTNKEQYCRKNVKILPKNTKKLLSSNMLTVTIT